MTLEIATLIICVLVGVGAYNVEKVLRQVIEKRFDEQERILDELKGEVYSLRGMLEDLEYKLDDNDEEDDEEHTS